MFLNRFWCWARPSKSRPESSGSHMKAVTQMVFQIKWHFLSWNDWMLLYSLKNYSELKTRWSFQLFHTFSKVNFGDGFIEMRIGWSFPSLLLMFTFLRNVLKVHYIMARVEICRTRFATASNVKFTLTEIIMTFSIC